MDTLLAEAATLKDRTAVLLENLCIRATTHRVALVGDWSALFALAEGRATLSSGRLELGGARIEDGMQSGRVGWAPHDLRWPDAWTGLELLSQCAKLFGYQGGRAEQMARGALATLGIEYLANVRRSSLAPHQKRALIMARAVLTEPPLLVLETPFEGLSRAFDEYVLGALERIEAGRRLLSSFTAGERSGPAQPWLEHATEIVTLEGSQAVVSPR